LFVLIDHKADKQAEGLAYLALMIYWLCHVGMIKSLFARH
jgi:hypothetical protein